MGRCRALHERGRSLHCRALACGRMPGTYTACTNGVTWFRNRNAMVPRNAFDLHQALRDLGERYRRCKTPSDTIHWDLLQEVIAEHKRPDLVESLLADESEVAQPDDRVLRVSEPGFAGHTALMVAAHFNRVEIARVLLVHRADRSIRYHDGQNLDGSDPDVLTEHFDEDDASDEAKRWRMDREFFNLHTSGSTAADWARKRGFLKLAAFLDGEPSFHQKLEWTGSLY
jgi:ankyrin repeat protein